MPRSRLCVSRAIPKSNLANGAILGRKHIYLYGGWPCNASGKPITFDVSDQQRRTPFPFKEGQAVRQELLNLIHVGLNQCLPAT